MVSNCLVNSNNLILNFESLDFDLFTIFAVLFRHSRLLQQRRSHVWLLRVPHAPFQRGRSGRMHNDFAKRSSWEEYTQDVARQDVLVRVERFDIQDGQDMHVVFGSGGRVRAVRRESRTRRYTWKTEVWQDAVRVHSQRTYHSCQVDLARLQAWHHRVVQKELRQVAQHCFAVQVDHVTALYVLICIKISRNQFEKRCLFASFFFNLVLLEKVFFKRIKFPNIVICIYKSLKIFNNVLI